MQQQFRYAVAFACSSLVMWAACQKQQPAPKPPAEKPVAHPPAPHPAPSVAPEERRRIAPVDTSKDDPATPTWLPRPEEIAGWVRTTNVDAVYPGEWHRLSDARAKDCAEGYSIKAAYTCRYTSVLPEPGGGGLAEVRLFEAYSSDDAYGMFTAMTPAIPFTNLVGSSSCLEQAGGKEIAHGWQGRYYLYVALEPQAGPAPQVSVEKLAAGLVRPIPSAQPPAILNYFPRERRIPGHEWIARRHLHIFPDDVLKDVLRGSALQTTQALELNLDTLMAIVAYDPGDGEKPNYVWLIEYPSEQEARAALGRYKGLLRKIKPAPMVMMDMPHGADGEPAGRYLCGTWTADQESIDTMHVLNHIVGKLSGS